MELLEYIANRLYTSGGMLGAALVLILIIKWIRK